MDWGCSRPIGDGRTEAIIGTPNFMAPEMTEIGGPLSPSTDVYLLAASLERVLTGFGRHVGRNLGAVLAAAWHSAPAVWPTGFPTPLAAILDRACDRDPERRYPDAAAFAAALRDFARHRQALAACAAVSERLPEIEAAIAEALFEPTTPATPTLFDGPRFFGDPHVSWVPGGRLDERFFFDPAWLASHFDLTGAGAWRLRW